MLQSLAPRFLLRAFFFLCGFLGFLPVWAASSHCSDELVAFLKDPQILRELLVDEYQVPEKYLRDPERFLRLAQDPAHENLLNEKGVREAMVALEAEEIGILSGPILRSQLAEADYVDATGQLWDLKAPRSPHAHENWVFSIEKVMSSLKKQLDARLWIRGQEKLVSVLLDFSRLNFEHRRLIRTELGQRFSTAELERIVVFLNENLSEEFHPSPDMRLWRFIPSQQLDAFSIRTP